MTERRHLAVVSGPSTGGVEDAGDSLAHELSLPEDAPDCAEGATLYNAVGLRFEPARLIDYDAGDAIYRKGERVVCEAPSSGAEGGPAWAVVAVPSRRLLAKARLPRVLRRATASDVVGLAGLREREQAIVTAARRVVDELRLPVKIVRAEAASLGQRFVVFFTSEQKIAFRDVLREIGQATGERIDLRQMGARDAAKLLGGVGPCGLQLCCNTFLSDFAPVTMKMAKDQGMAPNPHRASGMCGRLLCCLVYEEAYYRAARQVVPRIGDRVTTSHGDGRVRDVDVLRMRVRIVLDSGEQLSFPAGDVQASPAGDGED